MTRILFSLILVFVFCPIFAFAQENSIEINPFIIDEKSRAGDILKYDIVVTNHGTTKANMYPIVNDISKSEGDIKYLDPSELDRDTSISRWIKFKRGVIELMPGTTTTIPLEINISSGAKPGKRFSRIAFPEGSNRPEAESGMATKSFVQLPINIEITEDIIEKVQIKEFSSLSRVFVNLPFDFNIKLENNGNKEILPKGNIYIYNRRGEEVSSLDINSDSEQIPSGENWSRVISFGESKGFGKFKARLEIEYGEKDKRDLQDTLYFWYFPWKILLLIFGATFLLLAILVTLIFKKTYVHHHQPAVSNVAVRIKRDVAKDVVNLKK